MAMKVILSLGEVGLINEKGYLNFLILLYLFYWSFVPH